MSEPDKDHFDDYEPAELVKCPRCDGLGEIDPGDGREEAECPECHGEGKVEP
jgi:DnaJ-class molecular chaperone